MINNTDQQLAEKEKLLKTQTQKYNKICNIRMLVSIIAIVLFILYLADRQLFTFLAFITATIIFVLLISKHEKLKDNLELIQSEMEIFKRNKMRTDGSWKTFEITGEEYLKDEFEVEKDLDIFGDSSLYQYLCIAKTRRGKDKLAQYFLNKDPDFREVKKRQEAIKELIKMKDFSQNIEINSTILGKNKANKEDSWFNNFLKYLNSKELLPKALTITSFLLPAITIISGIYTFNIKNNFEIFVLLCLLQFSISLVTKIRNGEKIQSMNTFCLNFVYYKKMLKDIENADFESEYLKALKKSLIQEKGVTKGIEKLDSISEAFKIMSNPYIYFLLQALFMWDIHCIRLMEGWKSKYGILVNDWMDVIGEIEALISLSVLGRNTSICFPKFIESKEPFYNCEQIYHPLIDSNKAISNSINLKAQADIITGSNMSGKTTFLRTIGINLVLAYSGAPVCAKNLEISKMSLFTSMRVNDDISKGISTFYAEVLRIKNMVEYSKKNKPMLLLIDEIFKGTNSADRIVGATQIIKSLNLPHSILMVSTHDFEICSLVENNEINGKNYHFEEFYKEDKIYFDYKIKNGRCITTNAKHILKMAGLM